MRCHLDSFELRGDPICAEFRWVALSSAEFRRFGDTFLDATLAKTLEATLASSTGVPRDLRGRLWDDFRLSSELLALEKQTFRLRSVAKS